MIDVAAAEYGGSVALCDQGIQCRGDERLVGRAGALIGSLISSPRLRLEAFKLTIASGLAQGNSIPAEAKEAAQTKPELAPDLKLLIEKNPKCAECDAENPTWCSINLGTTPLIS